MAVITITYEAKCKDCAHLVRAKEGRRVVHKCGRELRLHGNLHTTNPAGWSVTLKRKACESFKL